MDLLNGNRWFHNQKRPRQWWGRKQNQWLEVTKARTGDGVSMAASAQGSLALPAEEILEAGDLEGKGSGGIWTSLQLGQHRQDVSPNTRLPVETQPYE